MRHLLFVYGSLKQGCVRHKYIQNQRYLGVGVTAPKYGIFRVSSYPALVERPEDGQDVWGELYEVTESGLVTLDDVEGVSSGLYARQKIELQQFNLVRLPLAQDTFESLQQKNAETYVYLREIGGAANCGKFWLP